MILLFICAFIQCVDGKPVKDKPHHKDGCPCKHCQGVNDDVEFVRLVPVGVYPVGVNVIPLIFGINLIIISYIWRKRK